MGFGDGRKLKDTRGNDDNDDDDDGDEASVTCHLSFASVVFIQARIREIRSLIEWNSLNTFDDDDDDNDAV